MSWTVVICLFVLEYVDIQNKAGFSEVRVAGLIFSFLCNAL